jgi:hypothetical protein
MELRFERVRPHGFTEGDAAQHWFEQTDALRQSRAGRLSEASPLIPTTIWALLIIGGLTVISFVFLFADSTEGKTPQLAMILVVTTTVVASLLTVGFLDLPYGDHEGSIEPTAMRGTVTTLERTKSVVHPGPLPCDASGRPVRS